MEELGPWKKLGTKEIYKNPWVEVNEDQVIRPDGKEGIHTVIKMNGGVSVLPIDEEGDVYLTDEFHYGVRRQSLEVVSGGIDKGELPIEAAKRELQEELGLEAEEWIELGQVDPFTTVVVSPTSLFLARNLRKVGSSQEGTETIKTVKVKFEEAVRMVMASKITHGQSCVLIMKVNELLKQKV